MNFFKNNLTIKILAGLCALLLWIFVANIDFKVDYLEKEIPIKAYNIREDLALASDLGKIKLKVRAPKSLWPKLQHDSIDAYIDLKTYDQGEYEVEVKISSQDPKIQVLEKEPKKVRVVLEPLVSIKREVSLEISGYSAQGYEIKETMLSPKEVEISGAKSILEKIRKVAAPFELKGEFEEIKTEVVPKAYDENNQEIDNLSFSPQSIEATISFKKSTGVKKVEIKAKTTGAPEKGFWIEKIEISPATVGISGPTEKIKEVNFLETEEINVSGIKETKEEKVNLILPSEIQANPNQVLVKINIASSITTKSFAAAVGFENLDRKLKVDFSNPSSILLIVEGDSEILNSLSSASFKAEVDLKGKKAGTYHFKISQENISLPQKVSLKDFEPKEIEVNITEK
ncbi:MAG: CdaR family protein [Patescibacteria group bacterium]